MATDLAESCSIVASNWALESTVSSHHISEGYARAQMSMQVHSSTSVKQ